MAIKTIPKETKQEITKIIDEYNKTNFHRYEGNVAYFAEFKGKFLYLNRKEFDKISQENGGLYLSFPPI